MSDVTIVWNKLEDLYVSMNEVGAQSDDIETYFRAEVCKQDGLTGALSPLAEAMPKLAGWFGELDDVFDARWAGVADAIERSAQGLRRHRRVDLS